MSIAYDAGMAGNRRRSRVIAARVRARPPRRRRAPEVAQQELLDAAERVFARSHPDHVGLKDVAREAGVSHALIIHYFGSYSGLVEASFERKLRVLREAIMERVQTTRPPMLPGELLEMLFRALEDPVFLRLTRWMFASERPAAGNLAMRDQGLQQIARQLAQTLDNRPSHELVMELELILLCAVSAAYGYAMGKYALAAALGRQVTPELDEQMRQVLSGMIQARLRTVLVATPGEP